MAEDDERDNPPSESEDYKSKARSWDAKDGESSNENEKNREGSGSFKDLESDDKFSGESDSQWEHDDDPDSDDEMIRDPYSHGEQGEEDVLDEPSFGGTEEDIEEDINGFDEKIHDDQGVSPEDVPQPVLPKAQEKTLDKEPSPQEDTPSSEEHIDIDGPHPDQDNAPDDFPPPDEPLDADVSHPGQDFAPDDLPEEEPPSHKVFPPPPPDKHNVQTELPHPPDDPPPPDQHKANVNLCDKPSKLDNGHPEEQPLDTANLPPPPPPPPPPLDDIPLSKQHDAHVNLKNQPPNLDEVHQEGQPLDTANLPPPPPPPIDVPTFDGAGFSPQQPQPNPAQSNIRPYGVPIPVVREYDLEELKREIESAEKSNEEQKSNEQILNEIKEERKRLEEEREKLKMEQEEEEKKQKERQERNHEVEEKEEEPQDSSPKKEVRSFAQERRKRKELERMQTYLFAGEWALLFVFVLAQLYSEGISADPLKVPFENTLYIIIIFFLVIKIEKFMFRYFNMKFSGTVQRKAIGVDLFKSLEWPIVVLWTFVIVIFILPPTHEFLATLVEIFTMKGEIHQASDGILFNITLLFVIHLGVGIFWIIFLTNYKNKVITPELRAFEEPFKIEEVFLITNSGLLIRRVSKRADSDMDDDILSSMLTAVKEFVKDSFGSKSDEGELDELQYGNMRIIIEYGKELYMAVLVRGQESKDLRPTMKRILKLLHRKYAKAFDTWDGDLARFKGSEPVLKTLLRLG